MFFIAQFLQVAWARNLGAGLRLLPWTATLFIADARSPRHVADRVGHRRCSPSASASQAVGLAWLAVVASAGCPSPRSSRPLRGRRIGTSTALPVSQAAIVGAVTDREIGKAAGPTTCSKNSAAPSGSPPPSRCSPLPAATLRPDTFAGGFSAAMTVSSVLAGLGFLASDSDCPPAPAPPTQPTPHTEPRRDEVFAARSPRCPVAHRRQRWRPQRFRPLDYAPHRRELHAHCYGEMLGSTHVHRRRPSRHDAARLGAAPRFARRGSLRTSLFTIATNASLAVIERNGRRHLPVDLGRLRIGPPMERRSRRLEPYPTVDEDKDSSPESSVERRRRRAGVHRRRPAPVAEQRAVLVLRDVLGFSADEAAVILDTTLDSVEQRPGPRSPPAQRTAAKSAASRRRCARSATSKSPRSSPPTSAPGAARSNHHRLATHRRRNVLDAATTRRTGRETIAGSSADEPLTLRWRLPADPRQRPARLRLLRPERDGMGGPLPSTS